MLLGDKKKQKKVFKGGKDGQHGHTKHHKAKGALKKSAADVKVGPLRHCNGVHADGAPLLAMVQVRWRVLYPVCRWT
jgi:hypothetical protein